MPDNSIADRIEQAFATMRQGHLPDALDQLQPLIADPPPADADHLRVLLAYGDLLTLAIFYLSVDASQPRAILEQARDLAAALDDEAAYAAAIDGIGLAHYYQQLPLPDRDFAQAQEHFEQALSLTEPLGDNLALANVHFHLGLVAQMRGDNVTAGPHFEQASVLAEGHPIEKSEAVRHLGFLAYMADDYETAAKHLRESLRLREQADYRMGLAFAHLSLGDAILQLGQVDEAIAHFRSCLDYAAELDNRRAMALGWLSLGEAFEKQQDTAQAIDAYQKAQTYAVEVGHVIAQNAATERLEALNAPG